MDSVTPFAGPAYPPAPSHRAGHGDPLHILIVTHDALWRSAQRGLLSGDLLFEAGPGLSATDHRAEIVYLHIGSEAELSAPEVTAALAYVETSGADLVCATGLAELDRVAACVKDAATHWIVEAGPEEALITLMAAREHRRRLHGVAGLRDTGSRAGPTGRDAEAALARLTDELARMGRWLSALSADGEPDAVPPAVAQDPVGYRPMPDRRAAPAVDAARIRRMLAERRLRARFFDDLWFGEPCWDMLLDLMAARLEGQRVSVSSLCIASAVPPTTALRWMKAMTERGLIERISDPKDARRIFVQLSDGAADAMQAWFAAVDRQAR